MVPVFKKARRWHDHGSETYDSEDDTSTSGKHPVFIGRDAISKPKKKEMNTTKASDNSEVWAIASPNLSLGHPTSPPPISHHWLHVRGPFPASS